MNQNLYDGNTEYDNLEGLEWEQCDNDVDEDENYDLDKFDYYNEFVSYFYENYDIDDCDYKFDCVDILTILN